MCQEAASRLLPVKGFQERSRQRLEECRRNLELAFREAQRARRLPWRGQGADFGDGRVALAQKNRLTSGQAGEVAGEMGLGLVYIEPDHDSIVDHL